MKPLFLALFLLISLVGQTQQISGIVYDSTTNEVLEFVNVQDVNSLKGTITNIEGLFELNSEVPTTIRISFLGYNSTKLEITAESEFPVKVYLSPQSFLFEEVVLEAEKLNLGKEIIQKVIKTKRTRKKLEAYTCDVYQQTKMTKFTKASEKDSIPRDTITVEYLNELASTHHVDGNKFKKIVKAEIKTTGDNVLKRVAPMTSGRDFKGSNRFVSYNPIEYFVNPEDFEIDIYDNTLNNPSISDRPITSPLAATALANYTYRLKKMEFVDQDTLFTIAVRPRFKGAPLWEGFVYVNSNGYKVYKSELDYNPDLNGFSNLEVDLIYSDVDGQQIPTDKRISYKSKVGNASYDVKSTYRTSSYDVNPEFQRNFFSFEQVRYEEGALKPNADLMMEYRGVALEKDLKIFFNEQDSIYRSITSDEYLQEQDSIFNSVTWKKITLDGFSRRNRAKGITYRINGVLQSFQAFGVDGFRINPGGSFEKEFINSDEIDIGGVLSYGITNRNIKGRGTLGYTFFPQKFARFFVGGGDIFDVITINQSLDAIISRSNFISHKFVNAGYSMELVNGLYFNSKIEYSDKETVAALNTNIISEFLFGTQDSAVDFDRYKVFTAEVDFIYRFGQKYMTRGRKKIVLPDNNPVLKVTFRKGIPGIRGSEVNYNYLEAELKQQLPQTKLGSLNWRVRLGSFLTKKSLRALEYNYFRGSTPFVFTNPLNDLVEIGATRATPNPFLQAAAIHHFNGFFLDKVPLINKLQMELLAGAGTLIIPDQGLYHAEIYAGIGKKFKLWGETIQLAAYAVTADSSLQDPVIRYKVGLNFYNAFAREWLY